MFWATSNGRELSQPASLSWETKPDPVNIYGHDYKTLLGKFGVYWNFPDRPVEWSVQGQSSPFFVNLIQGEAFYDGEELQVVQEFLVIEKFSVLLIETSNSNDRGLATFVSSLISEYGGFVDIGERMVQRLSNGDISSVYEDTYFYRRLSLS